MSHIQAARENQLRNAWQHGNRNAMVSTTPEAGNSYVIDTKSGAELSRLYDQDQLMTNVAGGVFPKRLDLTNVYSILDLACGPGGWAIEAAHSLQVPCVGVDLSSSMIQYARMRAQTAGIDDLATFQMLDITQPLPFEDGSLDLVHARFLAGVVPKATWPALLHDCFRVLNVGGYVLLTEAEWATTTSPAAEQLAHKATEAVQKAGLGFSTTGRNLGVAHALPALLRASGGRDVQSEAHLLNFSYRQPHYTAMVRNLWTTYQLMQPFLTRMGCGSQEEIFTLCDRLGEEVWEESFAGGMFLLRTWAQKSDEPQAEPEHFLPPSFPTIISTERPWHPHEERCSDEPGSSSEQEEESRCKRT